MGGWGFQPWPPFTFYMEDAMSGVSTDWVPKGSVAYDTAYADGEHHLEYDDGSVYAAFSTTPYRPPKARDPRHCIGNDDTCKGFKSGDTDFCSGHRKAIAKAAAV